MVSFTGSTPGGAAPSPGACGDGMKRQLLELGGKGVAIVFEDAAIDRRRRGGVASTWAFHSGQICTAPTRVLVHTSRVDEVVAKLTGAAGAPDGRRPARPRHGGGAVDLGDSA